MKLAKIILIVIVTIGTFLYSTQSASAEKAESEVSVFIVGEDSVDDSTESSIGNVENTKQDELPKSGESSSVAITMFGVFFLFLLIVFFFYRKNKRFFLFFLFISFSLGLASNAEATVPSRMMPNGLLNTPTSASLPINSAKIADQAEAGTLHMTNGYGQSGAMWSTENNVLDLSKDFELEAMIQQTATSAIPNGGGLSFTMQAKRVGGWNDGAPRWYSFSNSSLGTMAQSSYKNTIDGIPYSVAIEFDLDSNRETKEDGKAFDLSAGGYHIANVYPGLSSDYFTRGTIPNRYREQAHWNLQQNLPLMDGNWTKMEVKWVASTSQLSYRISSVARNYDSGWRNLSSGTVRGELGLNIGYSKAYWGFTASTEATNNALQKVVFTKLPGYVTAETNIELFKGEEKIQPGETVSGNSRLKVNLKSKYLSGTKNLAGVKASAKIPENLLLVPNTTKVNGASIPDSYWQGKELSNVAMNDYSSTMNTEQTVSFEAVVKNVSSQNNAVSNSFANQEATYYSEQATFNTSYSNLDFNIIAPSIENIYLDDVSEFKVDVNIVDESQADLQQQIKTLDGTILQSSTITGGAIEKNHSVDFFNQFKQLNYGDTELIYELTSPDGTVTSKNFTITKKSKPVLEVFPNEEEEYFLGEKIPFHFDLTDKDSNQVSVYMQIGAEQPKKILDFSNNPETINEVTYELDTKDLASGYYNFKWYVVDEANNQSLEVAYPQTITIEGVLSFHSLPKDFSESNIALDNSKVKTSPLDVSIVDTRINPTPWSLTVTSNTGFYNNQKNSFAPNTFFSYSKDNKSTLIEKGSTSYLIQNYLSQKGEVVSVDESGEDGFYLSPDNGMYKGTYTENLTWTLEATPSE